MWSGKNSRCSRRISRTCALHRKGQRNSRVVPPFPESSRCLSPFHGHLFSLHCLDIHADDRPTQRWHLGQPCGKACLENLVGMPRWKATDPLIVGPGRLTLVLELGRKAHVHAPTRDEDSIAWGDSRSTPGSMSGLERNPQVPAPTPDKVLGSGIYGRGIQGGPLATRMGTCLS